MEISIDLSVTCKNVRCPVTVDPDVYGNFYISSINTAK